jgi:hypothetical protein
VTLLKELLARSPLPPGGEDMAYRIAGIDVHKKMLAVVVSDVEVEGEYEFERRRYGSNPEHLLLLVEWLIERQVEEVVMVFPAKRDSIILERHRSMVGDGDAVRIGGEIVQNKLGTTEGWLGIDDPVLVEELSEKLAKATWLSKILE